MANQSMGTGTKIGTAGGTLLSVLANITSGDLLHTAILAAVGAVVSFSVSMVLKWLVKFIQQRNRPG